MLILLAAMTGMRLGELRALRWSDIDYRAMKIRVRREDVRGQYDKPKSLGSERGIPLAARLVTELDEHHQRTVSNQDSDLVLAHPHTGRPLDHARIGLHYHAALVRADVRKIRVHDLRHTFGTTMAASGKVSLRTLQEWMGHEDIRTTQIYADYMPGEPTRYTTTSDLTLADPHRRRGGPPKDRGKRAVAVPVGPLLAMRAHPESHGIYPLRL